jgi:hypothetical protein
VGAVVAVARLAAPTGAVVGLLAVVRCLAEQN